MVAGDRIWWARAIARADIVDLGYVEAQLGRRVTAGEAILRYVLSGYRTGMSLNPLFCEQTVTRVLTDDGRVPALYAYLVNDRAAVEVSPNWDAPAYARANPSALEDPAGPLGAAWRALQAGYGMPFGRGERTRIVGRSDVSALAARGASASAKRAALVLEGEPRDVGADGLTAVVVIAGDERDPGAVLRQAAVLAGAGSAGDSDAAEVLVEVVGPSATVWTQAALMALWAPLRIVRFSGRRTAAEVVETAAGEATGGRLLVRGPHAETAIGTLPRLAEAARGGAVAPVWLGPDGTVAAAGVVVEDGSRSRLLVGLGVEDARRVGPVVEVDEIAGLTYARPLTSTGSGGASILTDLTVVAPVDHTAERGLRGTRRGETILDRIGLATVPHGSGVRYSRPSRTVALADGTRVPSLRWAIKTASPAGAAGESWGDTHFARGLAAALTRLGQEVVVDARPALDRETSYLDDVSLVLRGPHRLDPPAGGRSILWVISHPDEITDDELRGFDRVFAASEPWAAARAESSGVHIAPLFQCTDARRFAPTGAARGSRAVFVGTARGIVRPSVVEPIKAGIPVDVYGPDWRAFIPASSIVKTGVPNSELPAVYESAGVVLNDHWPAMQRNGFIANRPFDVIAAGGRVISDHVEGIDELFEGALRSYRTIPELIEMLRGDVDALFPQDEELNRISELVRGRDSFDVRARQLLDSALELR